MNTTTERSVWIDAAYDRKRASDGLSRYGAYVKQNLSGFAECWDGTFEAGLPVHFAVQAWRVATGPIMAPGFVRYHRRVLSVRLDYSYWRRVRAGGGTGRPPSATPTANQATKISPKHRFCSRQPRCGSPFPRVSSRLRQPPGATA